MVNIPMLGAPRELLAISFLTGAISNLTAYHRHPDFHNYMAQAIGDIHAALSALTTQDDLSPAESDRGNPDAANHRARRERG